RGETPQQPGLAPDLNGVRNAGDDNRGVAENERASGIITSSMPPRFRSALLRYTLAAASYGLMFGTSRLLRWGWGISFDSTTLIILTMIASAWYGGLGPGLLVALL